MKTKTLIIITAAITAAAFMAAIAIFTHKDNNKIVIIKSDSEVLYRLDLSSTENKNIKIPAKSGYNIVRVQNGTISVSEATCPDGVCIRHGILKSNMNPIVCLPNKLVITFGEE